MIIKFSVTLEVFPGRAVPEQGQTTPALKIKLPELPTNKRQVPCIYCAADVPKGTGRGRWTGGFVCQDCLFCHCLLVFLAVRENGFSCAMLYKVQALAGGAAAGGELVFHGNELIELILVNIRFNSFVEKEIQEIGHFISLSPTRGSAKLLKWCCSFGCEVSLRERNTALVQPNTSMTTFNIALVDFGFQINCLLKVLRGLFLFFQPFIIIEIWAAPAGTFGRFGKTSPLDKQETFVSPKPHIEHEGIMVGNPFNIRSPHSDDFIKRHSKPLSNGAIWTITLIPQVSLGSIAFPLAGTESGKFTHLSKSGNQQRSLMGIKINIRVGMWNNLQLHVMLFHEGNSDFVSVYPCQFTLSPSVNHDDSGWLGQLPLSNKNEYSDRLNSTSIGPNSFTFHNTSYQTPKNPITRKYNDKTMVLICTYFVKRNSGFFAK